MDVTTLPKEMLANILRYTQFEDVHKMRTLNTYVDATVNQYRNLKRIPIVFFDYRELTDNDGEKKWSVSLIFEESVLTRLNFLDRGISTAVEFQLRTMETKMEKMVEYASKFKLYGTLSLTVSVLDDNLFLILDKLRKIFKHSTDLHFCDVQLTVPKETMRRFLDMLPNLNNIYYTIMRPGMYGSEILLNPEVLGHRSWERINFYSMPELDLRANLDDRFLMEIAPNCQSLEILCCRDTTSFTFQGVINMMKEILSRGAWKQHISLGTIQLGETRFSAVRGILKSFDEAEYTCVDEKTRAIWQADYKIMDVTTLPKEMLANILRYTQFEDVYKMRTLNIYVNATVNQYSDLKRIPISNFEYYESTDSDGRKVWTVVLSLEESVLKCFYLSDRTSSTVAAFEFKTMETRMDEMIECAKKVKLRGALSLGKSTFDANVFLIMEKLQKRFKHCTRINFSNVQINVSKDTMRNFLEMLPNLKIVDFSITRYEIYGSEILFCPEVLGKRNWKKIHFFSRTNNELRANFDNRFLMEVAPNCQALEIICGDAKSFTFGGVVNMIKEILSLGVRKQNISLGTIKLGETRLSDVGRILRTIKELEYTCMNENTNGGWKANYKITFNYSELPNHLYFEIEIPYDVDLV